MDDPVKVELRRFCESTSIKGIPRAVKSTNAIISLLWILAMVVCLAMLLFQATTVLIRYYSCAVIRNSFDRQTKPNFPEVTVCNLNPYDSFENFAETYEEYVEKVEILLTAHNVSVQADDQFFEELLSKRSYIVNNPTFSPRPYTPSMDTFVTTCNWYTWDWTVDNQPVCLDTILVTWHPQYYKCYTFQPNSDSVKGLVAVFYVHNFPPTPLEIFQIFLGQSMSAGVRLIVHTRGTQPFLQKGISISPGVEATITLVQTNITRLEAPYGNCTKQRFLTARQINIYTSSVCLSLCRQRQFIDICGCLVSYEALTLVDLERAHYSFCSNLTEANETYYSEPDRLLQKATCDNNTFPHNNICDCRISCDETQYDWTVSQLRWPHKPRQLPFYQKYIRSSPNIYRNRFDRYGELLREYTAGNLSTDAVMDTLEQTGLIEKNFLQLNVYFDTEIVHMQEDTAATTWETLMSNIGGALNLWLGVTVLFAAELIELTYDLFVAYRSRNMKPTAAKQNLSQRNGLDITHF